MVIAIHFLSAMSGLSMPNSNSARDSSPTWDAFISYSSADAEAATRLQRFLERYKLPDRRRLKVYRDETDIASGELPQQLRQALAASGALLVCCSAAACDSDWVNREIEAYRELNPDGVILPVLVAGQLPAILPAPLREQELRWADLRTGWRWGWPVGITRVEMVRAVAAVAGIDFRDLLPMDRRRRRRIRSQWALAIAVVLLTLAWWPQMSWTPLPSGNRPVVGCDTLDDGIVAYEMNEPQAVKNIVTVRRNILGANSESALTEALRPQGRLLPRRLLPSNVSGCPGAWWGEPSAGRCLSLGESDEMAEFADPMGGGEVALTEIRVAGRTAVIEQFWRAIDWRVWQDYGRTVHPSFGLPISRQDDEIWLGFADGEFSRGYLWHSVDGGRQWQRQPGLTDIRSVRHTALGLLVAGRLERELGFYLRQSGIFVPFDVPGKGESLEICGEVNGQPVIRTDRVLYQRGKQPRWQGWLE